MTHATTARRRALVHHGLRLSPSVAPDLVERDAAERERGDQQKQEARQRRLEVREDVADVRDVEARDPAGADCRDRQSSGAPFASPFVVK